MDKRELLEVLVNIGKGMYKLLGKDAEVVVHDLQEKKIVHIENAALSGRDGSYSISDEMFDMIEEMADEDNQLIGYRMKSDRFKDIRSSHFIFYDENHEPVAMICANQDLGFMTDFMNHLDNAYGTYYGKSAQTKKGHIYDMTKKLVLDIVDEFSSSEMEKRETKLKAIAEMYNQGVFDVKDSVQYVARTLKISRTSVYNYLAELKESRIIGQEISLGQ